MMGAAIEKAKTKAGPFLVAGLVVATLSGCALRPNNDTFDLTASAGTVSAERVRARNLQILVPKPSALQALDSRNIVVRLGGSEIRYLGQAQWSDQLPSIIQARLVAGLENTGLFGGVGMPGQGLAIDYRVIVEVREFAVDATGPGAANVTLSVKLLNDRTGVVTAQRLFSTSVAVNASSSNGVLVSALDRAFADAQTEIVAWISSEI
ncbi:ABC-type transport auxiliary lipoprotein family protein [Martelella mediterranea]|uniref:Cholesterol transport system auxiliary component n=1 Tax=Martelella mediterranea TaxID=293089 RepID=A0A4R3NT11_9HYPH|nr:ABC-type transport auxiliary lipoprotein family protein [Martelella mediterranea]TCT40861.1 cholesterol transport system auxiliary component [Martelella mediterranea]